jgi:hypothetical protein
MFNTAYFPTSKYMLLTELRSLNYYLPDHRSIRKGAKYWDVADDFVFQLPGVADAQLETVAAGS